MIEIKYKLRDNIFSLNAVGHADYASKGSDIVCSAVTALLYTLSFSASSLHDNDIAENVSADMESGNARICFNFNEKQKKVVECTLLPVVSAMNMVACRYPQNVSVTQI